LKILVGIKCFGCFFYLFYYLEEKSELVYFFIPDGFLGFSRGVVMNFSSKSTPIFSEGKIFQIL